MEKLKEYFGRMSDPTAAASLKGPCGEEMEFYLTIKDDRIQEVKFYTEGCQATKDCGAMVAYLAEGKTIDEALSISASDVMTELEGLPPDHLHCSILAVSTLYRVLANHLLRWGR